jgi:hypothetical protein
VRRRSIDEYDGDVWIVDALFQVMVNQREAEARDLNGLALGQISGSRLEVRDLMPESKYLTSWCCLE